MHLGRVVAQPLRQRPGFQRLEPDPAAGRIVRGPAERHEPADVGRHHRQVPGDVGEACGPLAVHAVDELAGFDRRIAELGDEDAARGETAVAAAVELLGEEHRAGPERVGRIDDDHVELRPVAAHVHGRVGDHQIEPRIVEGAGAHFRDPLSAELDHAAVDLDLGDRLDRGVACHLPQRAAVAAADDADVPRPAVREDRRVCQHLVIGELVGGGELQHIVERDHPAPVVAVEHQQVLVVGAAAVDDLAHPQSLPPVPVQLLFVPLALEHQNTPRSCSVTVSRPGRKARRRIGMVACGSAAPHMKTSNAA